MSRPPLKLAVFDCDGTIVDSRKLIVEGMVRSFAAHDLPIPSSRAVMDLVGLPLRDVLVSLSPSTLPARALDALADTYSRTFVSMHGDPEWRPPMYPGTVAMLLDLVDRHGALLGIATGKSRRGLVRTMTDFDEQLVFATTWTADDGPGKPNPAILEEAMRDVGVGPDECVMVGDTTFDIEMGHNAGMKTVAVPWGNHTRDRLLKAQPNILVESWDEFISWLDANFSVWR